VQPIAFGGGGGARAFGWLEVASPPTRLCTTIAAPPCVAGLAAAAAAVRSGSVVAPSPLPTTVVGPLVFFDSGLLSCRDDPGRRPSDYELSLGKITDTLLRDYEEFLDRDPEPDIYDQAVSLEITVPAAGTLLRGKQRYVQTICTLRRLTAKAVSDGRMTCRAEPGDVYGCALRIRWRCDGTMTLLGMQTEIHFSAISSYCLTPQAEVVAIDGSDLSYRIRRHRIEFLNIHPPSLRTLVTEALWHPRPVLVTEPSL